MSRLLGCALLCLTVTSRVVSKWVEGRVDTKENWAFLARFCFLSLEGQFEYLIEYDKDMGTPNLLLYYDDESQWPAVYHSSKSCKEREEILSRAGQNQIVKLSHWYPDVEYSGCILSKNNEEQPASKRLTTARTTIPPKTHLIEVNRTKTTTKPVPPDSTYYDQFLKTTHNYTTVPSNISSTWYEVPSTEFLNASSSIPLDELWENIDAVINDTDLERLKDVEILFDDRFNSKIKRSLNLVDRFKKHRFQSGFSSLGNNPEKESLVVTCHNSRRFRSARERWWFIAISNCDSNKGLDVRYKFVMTNGPSGDFWHEHFSADEFYVLPILLAYTFAYVFVMVAVVMCSVELKSRHLLHSTYKLFLVSIIAQHAGVTIHTLSYVSYATSGTGGQYAKTMGQFICGLSEMTFLLLLVLMAKGYTITRGRLKVGFTVKLTVFMCGYFVTYIVLFIYQSKAFDPGEVLYLYESPAGYGLIILRIFAWCVFAYATFFTVKKFPEKNMFYFPFFICGTLWFYAGPLFILTANTCIDKWVRESVVTAVLLFISFCGHIMFLLLTLPVFANKNFPYFVRTTQIGVMEATRSPTIDSFGHNAYHPTSGAPQTVIIPLTRRTEEILDNMYSRYITTPPSLTSDDVPKLNGTTKVDSPNLLKSQESTETNSSADIKPILQKEDENKDIFTIENSYSKIQRRRSARDRKESLVLPVQRRVLDVNEEDLPLVQRSRRNILEPIKREEKNPVPSWSLAKGPPVNTFQKNINDEDNSCHYENATGLATQLSAQYFMPRLTSTPEISSPWHQGQPLNSDAVDLKNMTGERKVPPVRNGLQSSSGEISTILEGRIQTYPNIEADYETAEDSCLLNPNNGPEDIMEIECRNYRLLDLENEIAYTVETEVRKVSNYRLLDLDNVIMGIEDRQVVNEVWF